MSWRTAIEWAVFAVASVVLWLAAGLYMFIAGGASCQVTGTCLLDRSIVFLTLLLLPAQAGAFAWLRSRQRRRGTSI